MILFSSLTRVLWLVLVVWSAGGEEECHVEEDEIDFCAQNRMMRASTLFYDMYPSYCFYEQENVAGVDFNVHQCGWKGITQIACISAGCCYRDHICFEPLRPEITEFFFEKTWLNYNKSREKCLKDGKDLFCPRHRQDLEYMSENLCGISWLKGSLIEDDVTDDHSISDYLPFYHKNTGCYQKRISCLSESNDHFSIIKSNQGQAYRIEIRPETDKRHLLCAREQWTHFIDTYPQHIRYDGTDDNDPGKDEHVNTTQGGSGPGKKRFYCGIEFTQNLEVNISWIVTDKNGTLHNITKTSGKYRTSVEPTVIGNYTCIITLSEPPFVNHNHVSWLRADILQLRAFAYYYQNITLSINVTVKSTSPEISNQVTRQLSSGGSNVFEALLGDEITVLIQYKGFPYPKSSITSRLDKVSHATKDVKVAKSDFVKMKKRRQDEDKWIIDMFAKEVSLFDDHYKQTFSVIFSSKIYEDKQATQTFIVSKVFIKWALDNPPPDPNVDHLYNVSDKMTQQCFGHGVASLYEAKVSWTLNTRLIDSTLLLDYELRPRGYLTVTIQSARDSGVYKCTIDNGAARLSYRFKVKVRAPPSKPSQPYVKRVKLEEPPELVMACPKSDDLWDNLIYTVTLFEKNKTINTTSTTNVSFVGKEIVAAFPIKLSTSYTIRYNVTNEWGTSQNSDYSYSIVTSVDHPTTPGHIKVNSTQYTSKSLHFEYEVSEEFSSYEGYLFNNEYSGTSESVPENGITVASNSSEMVFHDLQQNTHYAFVVRGVKITRNGTIMYGPASPRYIARTGPDILFKLKGFRVQQVESDDKFGVILLNWNTPEREVTGYQLNIKQLLKNSTDTVQQNTTDTATSYIPVKTRHIRRTAISYLSKDNDGVLLGHTYLFELRAMLSHSQLSQAVVETVIVSSSLLCPAVLDKPIVCGLRIFPKILTLQYVIQDVSSSSEVVDTTCFSGVGREYIGGVSRTRTGVRCRDWKSTKGEYSNLPNNLCRNPEGSNRTEPWCLTSNAVLDAEACDVPPCGRFKTTLTLRKNGTKSVTTKDEQVTKYGVSGCVSFVTTHNQIDIGTVYDYGIDGCGGIYTNMTENISRTATLYGTIWFKYLLIHCFLASIVGSLWCYIGFRRKKVTAVRMKYIVDLRRARSSGISRAYLYTSSSGANKYERRMTKMRL